MAVDARAWGAIPAHPAMIPAVDPALIRAAALFGPLAVVWVVWTWRPPDRRWRAAVYLGVIWNAVALLALHRAAAAFGWWRFAAEGGLVLGMPADLWLGWALLWGALPALAMRTWRLPAVVATLLGLDLLLMPAARPVLWLGPHWLAGEAAAIAGCLVPGVLLARWTGADRRLAGRAALQAVGFTALAGWALPAVILEATGGAWSILWQRPPWLIAALSLLMLPPALAGFAAVRAFAARGGGTPVPFDPPRRLVTTGPYAYLANPMQASACVLWLLWGAWLGSAWVMAAGLMGVIYSAALGLGDEDRALTARFGARWAEYRAAMRPWRLRRRPWFPTGAAPSRLWFDPRDPHAARIAGMVEARAPVGLAVLPAGEGDSRASLLYEPGDGSAGPVRGVRAVARALEHVHLGWALVGWAIELSGMGRG